MGRSKGKGEEKLKRKDYEDELEKRRRAARSSCPSGRSGGTTGNPTTPTSSTPRSCDALDQSPHADVRGRADAE
jgi:hypothetical protein